MIDDTQDTLTEPTPEAKRQAAIYDTLDRLGITEVSLTYSGFGDSGCLENPEAYSGSNLVTIPDDMVSIAKRQYAWDPLTQTSKRFESMSKPMPLTEAILDWCYDLLGDQFPGWEINEGSSGTIIIDVATRTGTFHHEQNVPQYEERSF